MVSCISLMMRTGEFEPSWKELETEFFVVALGVEMKTNVWTPKSEKPLQEFLSCEEAIYALDLIRVK